MAEKLPENVPGLFYVTDECIGCGLCVSTAETNFRMTDDDSFAFVCRQPESDAETVLCQEALDDCPADAIERD